MGKSISFSAILPKTKTAIQVSGGEGGRVSFDFPQEEVPNVVGLAALHDVLLKVTVEVVE